VIRVEVRGESLIDLADDVTDETLPVVKDLMRRASDSLLSEVRRRLRTRQGPEPSPPGEPPAQQTGALARSFERMPVRVRGRTVSGGIRSTEDYRKIGALEYGGVRTPKGTQGSEWAKRKVRSALKSQGTFHIRARPFLRPSEA